MATFDSTSDNTDARRQQHSTYEGDTGEDSDMQVPFVQLVGDDKPQSTIFGEGARVKVTADEDGVTVTASADLKDPERLLGRDIISVVLCGKDLPEEDDEQ